MKTINTSQTLPDIEVYKLEKQHVHAHEGQQVSIFLNCEVIPRGTVLYKGVNGDNVDNNHYVAGSLSVTRQTLSHHSGFMAGRDEASGYAYPSEKSGTRGIFFVMNNIKSLHLVDVGDLHNINTIIDLIYSITPETVQHDFRYKKLWFLMWGEKFHPDNMSLDMEIETLNEKQIAMFFEYELYDKLTHTDFKTCKLTGRQWQNRDEMLEFFNRGDIQTLQRNNTYIFCSQTCKKLVTDPNKLTNMLLVYALQQHYFLKLTRERRIQMEKNESRKSTVDMYIDTFFLYNKGDNTDKIQDIVVHHFKKTISETKELFIDTVKCCFALESDDMYATAIFRYSKTEYDNQAVNVFEYFIYMFFPYIDGWIYNSDEDINKYREPPDIPRYKGASNFHSEILLLHSSAEKKLALLYMEEN